MKLELNRRPLESSGEATIGGFYIDGVWKCFSLEDKDRHLEDFLSEIAEYKIPGKTAIPRGRYRVTIDWSDRQKSLRIHILDVPGFEGIRIDIANYTEEIQGCIALGMERKPEHPSAIFRSTEAVKMVTLAVFEALLRGEEIWLSVS